MIIKSEKLKDVSKKILTVLNSTEFSSDEEALQLKAIDNNLYLRISNSEYYASIKLDIEYPEEMNATVNAPLFLKLINQITTEDVDISLTEKYLMVKGNGKYKLPLIFVNDSMRELSEIIIKNVTSEMNISSDILLSILQYNSKEFNKGFIYNESQKMYYIDNKGCITYTTGACVNNFELEKPIKLLISPKVVKLFKLFKNEDIHFTLGYDAISNDIIQTKVRFEASDISITAIISCDDKLLNTVPVNAIRGMADSVFPYSVSISKIDLLNAINRLMLFDPMGDSKNNVKTSMNKLVFSFDRVTIYDVEGNNNEEVKYTEVPSGDAVTYECKINLDDVRLTLESFTDPYIYLSFGKGRSLNISRNNIKNVIALGAEE